MNAAAVQPARVMNTDASVPDMVRVALWYARKKGWRVFPVWPIRNGQCACGELDCRSAGKHPIGKLTEDWRKSATTDLAQIRQWWGEVPDANIATCDHLRIDVDVNHCGVDSWHQLTQDHPLPMTPTCLTPSGGKHLYFQAVEGLGNSRGSLPKGIDVRGQGTGYTVLPPSNHLKGRYEWIDSLHPVRIPLAQLPDWLRELLEGESKRVKAAAFIQNGTNKPDITGWALSEPIRQAILHTPNIGIDRSALDQSVITALVRLGKSDDEIKAVFDHYPIGIGGKYGDKGAHGAGYLALSINKARELLDGDKRKGNAAAHNISSKQGRSSKPTDDELRDQWLHIHDLTAYGLGEFRRYDEGIWRIISRDQIKREIDGVLIEAKSEGVRPTAGRRTSVLELARVKVSVPDQMWDADPDVLVCRNGVLHIPTRTLQPHAPDYYVTSKVPYCYDAAAAAPTFQLVLHSRIPEAAAFLQEFAGYCLTTDTRHELAVWLYGLPGSGRSTVIEGFKAMLGERAGILGLAEIERSSFALTNLIGKTLVVSTEQPNTYLKATSVLNTIISGESIQVDRKYHDPVILTPHAKILWAMNDYPRVDANNGLLRRVHVVEFPPLTKQNRDPAVKERIKQEGSGILNWALDGLERLQARGYFDVPQSVSVATEQFQQINDIPAMFVQECCLLGPVYETQSQPLYEAYCRWCESNGHKAKSGTRIAEDWKRLGFEKRTRNGRFFYQGVGMRQHSEA